MSGPVTIPYSLLLQPDETLPPLIREAFSSEPGALGLLIVSDLPETLEFSRLRKEVLLLSNKFASLPEETREKYTDPSKSRSIGPGGEGGRKHGGLWLSERWRGRRHKVELRLESRKGNHERETRQTKGKLLQVRNRSQSAL